MASKPTLADLLELTPDERLLLVEQLWDSLTDDPEAVPVTPQQRDELDQRHRAAEQNPTAGASWPEVKSRIQGGK